MASLGRLTIDMVANLAGFERDMGRAQRVTAKSMQSVGRDLRRAERDADRAKASIQRLGMQFAALAGVSLAVLVREFNQLAEQGDRIGKVAQGTGATVEAIQRLGFAAEQSGTSQEVLIKGLQTLQRNLQGARDGLTTYTRAFERIGVSTEELFKLNVEDQFLLIADALSKVENATTRSASAQEIFGRAGKELLAFFADGSQSARDWGDALERAGAVMGQELINDLENFNDQLNLLSKQFLGMKIQILENLIGPMAEFVEFLNTEEGTAALRETLDDLARTAIIVGNIIGIRLIGQLGVAALAFVGASIRAAQASMALAGMATTATASSGAFRGLGIAIRGMMGPLGIAATALGVFAISSKDSTAELLNFNEQMRDLRYESRQFASEQQIIKDMQSFQDEADAATEQIEQLKSGLDKLAGDRKAEETLSQYNQRMGAVAEKTELANAEIARLEVVAAEASEKARELGVELKNFETPAQRARRIIEELNNELRDEKRQQFLRDLQDISDELEGPAAQAARAFAREIEKAQLLLDERVINPEEFANFARGQAQLFNRKLKDISFADAITDSIKEGFDRIDAQTLLSGGFGAAMRVVGMTAFEGVGAKLGEKLGTKLGQKVGESLGDQLGGVLGEKLGATVGGAIGDAMGAAVPVIGQVVGSLIGQLLFGEKSPKFQVGGTTGFFGTGGAVKGQFETAFGTQLFRFRNLEQEVKEQIQQALIDFDNTIAAMITDDQQFGAIANALKNFGYDSQDEAASIQELLQQRFDAVLGTFDSFTQGIVRQAFGLEAQVQRLAELQQIQRQALFVGNMGFASQQDMIRAIADMQRGTESLVDTFNRFVTTIEMLQKVTDLTGVTFGTSHDALVAFGDELLKVFGDDMQKFTASLNTIFETFFDADEILEQAASTTRRRASQLFADLGIEITDALFTRTGFRQLFESLAGLLTPEDLAILIEAGVLVSQYIGHEEELNQVRSESIGVLTSLTAEGEAFAEAMIATEEAIATTPLNAFQREMLGINRQLYRTINAINSAAGSAITQEAAERALARAHESAAIQAAAAVARLEASTLRLVQQVFGTPLDEINRQISLLENNSNSVANALGNAADAMQGLIDFADSLLIGSLSPLPSRERLGLGLEQLRAASEAGDVQAVQALAQQVLQIGRERFASGPEFAALFQEVQDIIRSTVPAEDAIQPVEVTDSPALTALYAERDRAMQEQSEADRRANAVNIAQAIADISSVTGESFEEVAERLGVPLDSLANILGLDYDELDAFLTGLQADTMTLAQSLETYALQIRSAILEMTNTIIEYLTGLPFPETGIIIDPNQGPINLPGEQYGPFLPPSEQPPEQPPVVGPPTPPGGGGGGPILGPPGLPIGPPVPDPGVNQPTGGPLTFADLMFGKNLEKNTSDTVRAIERLADAVERSNTRSNRTALA